MKHILIPDRSSALCLPAVGTLTRKSLVRRMAILPDNSWNLHGQCSYQLNTSSCTEPRFKAAIRTHAVHVAFNRELPPPVHGDGQDSPMPFHYALGNRVSGPQTVTHVLSTVRMVQVDQRQASNRPRCISRPQNSTDSITHNTTCFGPSSSRGNTGTPAVSLQTRVCHPGRVCLLGWLCAS